MGSGIYYIWCELFALFELGEDLFGGEACEDGGREGVSHIFEAVAKEIDHLSQRDTNSYN